MSVVATYKGYKIHRGTTVFAAYEFEHEDYDGEGPDYVDRRAGHGATVDECKDRIDELEDDT